MTEIRVVPLRSWLLLTVLFLVSLQVLFTAMLQRERLEEELLERSLEAIRHDMAYLQSVLRAAPTEDPVARGEQVMAAFAAKPEVRALVVPADDGRVLLTTRVAWKGQRAAEVVPGFEPEPFEKMLTAGHPSIAFSADGRSINAYYPLSTASQSYGLRSAQLGGVFLSYDLGPDLDGIWRHVVSDSILDWLAMLVAMLGLLGALYVLVTRPVRKFVETARRWAAGDYGAQIRFKGHGELAELGRAFNEMSRAAHNALVALRKSEERWQFALEGNRDGVWDWSTKTDRVFFSKRWKEMLGYAQHEISDHLEEWEKRVHPDDRGPVYADFNRHLRGETPYYENEHRILCKDGCYKWILDRGMVIERDENNEPVRVIGTHTDITRRKEDEARIERLAFFDELTGLPNRRFLHGRVEKELASAQRHGHHGALLFIDLDNFKNINDSLGYLAGDSLLKQVAERLGARVRAEDCVGRLGGDEFVVLTTLLSQDSAHAVGQIQAIVEKLQPALDAPYELNGQSYHVTPSIGVAIFPEAQGSVDDLFKHADTAMYASKKAGRNAIRYFQPGMQEMADARLSLEKDLRLALGEGGFVIYYQPQVDTLSGRIIGAEALLRWMHPRRGMILPGAFIPLAEETGLILPIGDWVLRRAAEHTRAWSSSGLAGKVETIAVNVSPRQFHRPDFTQNVRRILDRAGADPTRLRLEITETAVAAEIGDTIEKMEALRELGIRFSLDDFGTGYSSLSHLKRLPIDQLKIDRSFLRDIPSDPHGAAIVETIIAMARHLGLSVTAEGVERYAQIDMLRQHNCDAYQGFYCSPPLPLDQFERLLEKKYTLERYARRESVGAW